jgi:hypothetical protein
MSVAPAAAATLGWPVGNAIASHVQVPTRHSYDDLRDHSPRPWRWAVKAGQLILQTPRFHVLVAQSQRQLPSGQEHDLPRLDEVRHRADRFGIR